MTHSSNYNEARSTRPSGPWANAWVPVWEDRPAPRPQQPPARPAPGKTHGK